MLYTVPILNPVVLAELPTTAALTACVLADCEAAMRGKLRAPKALAAS